MALDAAQVEALQISGRSHRLDQVRQRPDGPWSWADAVARSWRRQAARAVLHEAAHRPGGIRQAATPGLQGHPYIEMMMPGEKNVIIREPVWDQHLKRFPQQWQQFLAGEEEQVVGTPLKVAPFLTESQVEELGFFKIRTIEQLADLSDTGMNFMGAQELKSAAKRFIEKTTGQRCPAGPHRGPGGGEPQAAASPGPGACGQGHAVFATAARPQVRGEAHALPDDERAVAGVGHPDMRLAALLADPRNPGLQPGSKHPVDEDGGEPRQPGATQLL